MIVASLVFLDQVYAQSFADGFNFYLPPKDTAASLFLPQFPMKTITDQEFISVDAEGHFSSNGKPIRFFGTNFVADGAFPTKTKALGRFCESI